MTLYMMQITLPLYETWPYFYTKGAMAWPYALFGQMDIMEWGSPLRNQERPFIWLCGTNSSPTHRGNSH